jgi:Tol biopolymer transport system component
VSGGPVLHTINPEGSELRSLPNGFRDGFGDGMASWSPNGDKITFSVNVWDFVENIFIANADGTERRFFHGCIWFDNSCMWNVALDPKFSPDGTKIVFSVADRFQRARQVLVKNIDGTGLTLLADSARMPSWQPIPDQVVAGLVFDRTTVVAGSYFAVAISGSNLTPETFLIFVSVFREVTSTRSS